MSRFLIVAMLLVSLAYVGLAWFWVVTLDPASPLVPFACCFMGGLLFREAWQRLSDAIGA